MFAGSSEAAHPVHCFMRRDVAFLSGNTQLEYVQWRQADKIEIRFRGIGKIRIRLEK